LAKPGDLEELLARLRAGASFALVDEDEAMSAVIARFLEEDPEQAAVVSEWTEGDDVATFLRELLELPPDEAMAATLRRLDGATPTKRDGALRAFLAFFQRVDEAWSSQREALVERHGGTTAGLLERELAPKPAWRRRSDAEYERMSRSDLQAEVLAHPYLGSVLRRLLGLAGCVPSREFLAALVTLELDSSCEADVVRLIDELRERGEADPRPSILASLRALAEKRRGAPP
jgi:hypothetical protein